MLMRIFFISLTYFIDGFTSEMKFKLNACLLSGNERVYWILGLEVDVHSNWVCGVGGL
jgi:hypothetical protein